jgi:hypothetical protein
VAGAGNRTVVLRGGLPGGRKIRPEDSPSRRASAVTCSSFFAAPTRPASAAPGSKKATSVRRRPRGAVGRIYLVDSDGGNQTWFWGVSFQLTKRKSYGHARCRSRKPNWRFGRNILLGREPIRAAPVESAAREAQAPHQAPLPELDHPELQSGAFPFTPASAAPRRTDAGGGVPFLGSWVAAAP